MTLADPNASLLNGIHSPLGARSSPQPAEVALMDQPLAEVVRNALGGVPDKCRIQVIVQMKNDSEPDKEPLARP
jgi:hypothetical protein